MIITVIMTCGFLHASDDSLRLPLYYDPMTNLIAELPVDLRQIDHFTQCDFQTLMKRAFEQERPQYGITVFVCMNITGNLEYSVADTRAFYQWRAANGKVEPETNKPIIHNSPQNFIIEPAEHLGYRYEIFKLPVARYASSGEKRKRENDLEGNKMIKEIFEEIQADKERRRAEELAFLRAHD